MKKIISGRKYDTDTARLVAEWESGYPGDFQHFTETLYKKRTGEYFIHGVGGPASKYARSAGLNSWSGGSAIIPQDYESAREWSEAHLDPDEYEAEFGEVTEGESIIYARVPAAAKAKLERYCQQTGQTKGDVIAELIDKI